MVVVIYMRCACKRFFYNAEYCYLRNNTVENYCTRNIAVLEGSFNPLEWACPHFFFSIAPLCWEHNAPKQPCQEFEVKISYCSSTEF